MSSFWKLCFLFPEEVSASHSSSLFPFHPPPPSSSPSSPYSSAPFPPPNSPHLLPSSFFPLPFFIFSRILFLDMVKIQEVQKEIRYISIFLNCWNTYLKHKEKYRNIIFLKIHLCLPFTLWRQSVLPVSRVYLQKYSTYKCILTCYLEPCRNKTNVQPSKRSSLLFPRRKMWSLHGVCEIMKVSS